MRQGEIEEKEKETPALASFHFFQPTVIFIIFILFFAVFPLLPTSCSQTLTLLTMVPADVIEEICFQDIQIPNLL